MPPRRLLAASREARAARVPVEDALFAGPVREAAVADLLARRFGFARTEPGLEAAPGTRLDEALRLGAVRLADGRAAACPRGAVLERLGRVSVPGSVVLTTREHVVGLALATDRRRVAAEAAGGLARRRPDLAAVTGPARWQRLAGLALVFVLAFWAVAGPVLWTTAVQTVLCGLFLLIAWARLVACTVPAAPRTAGRRVPDRMLPVYTVLVPLYRERTAVAGLVRSLEALDYPRAKLDIKILVEERDAVTLRALARSRPPAWMEVVRVPHGAPRTKPRALNVGLRLARGRTLVVYDAEDRPEPGQLREALAAFARDAARPEAGGALGVVQAPLVIDPAQPGAIAAQFRLDYAGLFGVMLPALASFGLPVPLGGSSNHFPTAVLRQLGGWDAHNVTEDADLGLRLHRAGFRAALIGAGTEEEAPSRPLPWLKQRTRWFKGWIVTLMVHARHPRRLVREAGWAGALVFVLLTVGTVLSALLEPLGLGLVGLGTLRGTFPGRAGSLAEALLQAAFLASLVLGHGAALAMGVVGLRRAGLPVRAGTLALLPVYWLGLSVAAWRAVWQSMVRPFHWEKTEHVLRREHSSSERGRSQGSKGQALPAAMSLSRWKKSSARRRAVPESSRAPSPASLPPASASTA